MSIYLDNAATTMVCPEAAEAALNAMTTQYGNPSSTHSMGREAKKLLDASRQSIAKAMGCDAGELYFTSCGTESDNWAIIRGAQYNSRNGKHIISSLAEHAAVGQALAHLESLGFEVTRLEPDIDGSITCESVLSALREDTCLISLMLVNNETGAITDIAGISRELKKRGSKALLHTDAVQAFMKYPFSASKLGADMISISGHKIHAPKGIGALYIRKGLNIKPYIIGGSQENSKRAGTESMPLICAFAAAAKTAYENLNQNIKHIENLRRQAVEQLTAENENLVVIGGGAPHILSISLPGYRSEVIMNYLESKDIYVSKSSACKKGGRSHVLESMGLKNEIIDGAIRISFSRYNSAQDIDIFCRELTAARATLRHR